MIALTKPNVLLTFKAVVHQVRQVAVHLPETATIYAE